MKTISQLLIATILGALMLALTVSAETAEEIMKKSHMAYYYAGDDGLAQVNMVLTDKKGKARTREFTMLRIDIEEGGNQKYYTYFKKPSDVARMTFMVHKATDGDDKRWIYVPAVDLIRPISADDKNSSFVGSDFSYEDVSGRHWSEDNHILVEESTLDETPVFVIESTPKDGGYDGFAKKISYVSTETFLPLKEEYFDDKGEMIRVFTADRIEDMDGITTITLRRMVDLKKGSNTTVEFADIDYNVGMTDELFTERYLKNPPRQYVK